MDKEWRPWHEQKPDGCDSYYDVMVLAAAIISVVGFWMTLGGLILSRFG